VQRGCEGASSTYCVAHYSDVEEDSGGGRRLRRGHLRSMLPGHATGTLRTTGATLVRSAPHHGIGCQLRHSREFHARNSWRI
jgi:hypothetical protein